MATVASDAATTTAPSGPRRKQNRFVSMVKSPLFARILFPFVVLAFWYFSLWTISNIWPFALNVLPTPQEVWSFMWVEILDPWLGESVARRNVYQTFLISLYRLGIGFVIAMVLGTLIGLGMGLSRSVDAFFHDWVMAILAMPALAWALFASLVFGFTNTGPIVVVVLAGIPFVIVNVREGVKNAPKDLFDMGRAFRVPRDRLTRHVLLPSLMPFMFAAVRYAFSIGWKGLVIAEVFGSDTGAGWTIKFWYDAHRAHGVVGYAMFFVIFAMLIEKLVFEPASRRAFKWRPSAGVIEIPEEEMGAEMVTEATDRTTAGRDIQASVMFQQEAIYDTMRTPAEEGPGSVVEAEREEEDGEGGPDG